MRSGVFFGRRYRYLSPLTTHAIIHLFYTAIVWLAVTANVHATPTVFDHLTHTPAQSVRYAARKVEKKQLGTAFATTAIPVTCSRRLSPTNLPQPSASQTIVPARRRHHRDPGPATARTPSTWRARAARADLRNATPAHRNGTPSTACRDHAEAPARPSAASSSTRRGTPIGRVPRSISTTKPRAT